MLRILGSACRPADSRVECCYCVPIRRRFRLPAMLRVAGSNGSRERHGSAPAFTCRQQGIKSHYTPVVNRLVVERAAPRSDISRVALEGDPDDS